MVLHGRPRKKKELEHELNPHCFWKTLVRIVVMEDIPMRSNSLMTEEGVTSFELGKKLPAFPESEKVEANKAHGCQSQVWLIHYHRTEDDRCTSCLDSDALIVMRLSGTDFCMLNKKTAAENQGGERIPLTRLDLFDILGPTWQWFTCHVGKMLGVALATAVQRLPVINNSPSSYQTASSVPLYLALTAFSLSTSPHRRWRF